MILKNKDTKTYHAFLALPVRAKIDYGDTADFIAVRLLFRSSADVIEFSVM